VTQNLLEEQLSDGREWLLDTEIIGLADIAAHFHLTWGRAFRTLKDVLDPQAFPKTFAVSSVSPCQLIRRLTLLSVARSSFCIPGEPAEEWYCIIPEDFWRRSSQGYLFIVS
jgi:hypothetical protein